MQVIDKKGVSGRLPPLRAIPLLVVGTLSLGPASIAAVAQNIETAADTPNIIWIMADDLGYGDLGSYGQELIRTPRLDQMASEGMRFTNAYAGASVCAPSRAVLMTGLHQGHARVRWNSYPDPPLRDADITVAEVLRDSGYSTALIGKWGLGRASSAGAPWRQGFGHFFGYLDHVRAHNHYPAYLVGNGGLRIPLGNRVISDNSGLYAEIALTRTDYSDDLFVSNALEWIGRDRDGPFFLFLSLTIPHANSGAHKLIHRLPDELAEHRDRAGIEVPDVGDYAGEDWDAPLKGTAAMITRIDSGVGEILDKLEELGIDESTIVFFTSDNGPHGEGGNDPGFFDSTGGLRGIKRSLHDGGIRVPMIARWPTQVPAGTVSDLVWHFADFLPTAAELAGADLTHSIDGESVVPELLGRPTEAKDRFLYWRGSSKHHAAVRWGRWKAMRRSAESPVELYDLESDPGEHSNVACWHQGVVTNMREYMDAPEEPANLAPVFTSSNRFEVTGNPGVVGTVVAVDHDDAVTGYWVAGGPNQDRFEISDEGVLTFKPASSLEPSAEAADTGCLPQTALGSNQYGVVVGAAGGSGARRKTSLQPIVVRMTDGTEWPLTAGVLGPHPLRHAGQGVFSLRIAFSEPIETSYVTLRDQSLVVMNGSVRNVRRVDSRNDLWEIDIAPSSEAAMRVVLPPTTDCEAAGAVCTANGKRLQTHLEALILGPLTTNVSITALASPVPEGTAATYTVTLDQAAPEALAVAVSVTESGAVLAETPPASVAFAEGATSATLSVPTAADSVVEADSTVTATVTDGTGYTVGTAASAAVTVEDDDAAAFAVSTEPETILEGESSILTVAVANGVTFAEEQTISLATSGTASASDYADVPLALTLAAGASSVTATLTAAADEEDEPPETVTVTASHGGSAIGSATVTVNSVSHDATLGTLSLSGIDIGTFSGAVTVYEASVANSLTATTVTATATHPAATVAIEPASPVTLSEGANGIVITVTAEDGTTTKAYTAMVTRAALPVATIEAGTTPVTEGTAATYTVTLDQAAPEALAVAVNVAESGAALFGTPPASVSIAKGATSATLSVPTAGDSVVEADSTLTATLTAGRGYTVGTGASAAVTVGDDDAATFTVSADAEAIREGESATLTVAISNGVTFARDETISLATSGTAAAADYTGVPPTVTLAAGASSVTATLAAATDAEEEQSETVTVTASHGGSVIGSATVTINSISRDATLGTLSLGGIDIGAFSSEKTSYEANVDHSVETVTVTAAGGHSGATVTVEPGPEVQLAVGQNGIVITVTAEDGKTTKTYTVTVTRAARPVVSVVAVEERVLGPIGEFRLSRTGPTEEPLAVQVLQASSRSGTSRPVTVRFGRREASVTGRVQAGDNGLVEDDITMTWTLQAGEDYTVSPERASASLVLEESDIPEFAVTVEPTEIKEGESATVTVAIANGVQFARRQTIALAASGTASASDYTGLPETLALAARSFSATVTVAAAADREDEPTETVTVTASHGGSAIGAATVMIESVSSDATLAGLSLSGIDIGTFSGALTAYQANVANSVTATTATATTNHSAATVSIDPGAEVSLAEGANEITLTVTAEDGKTTKTYTVTVNRAARPEATINAGTTLVTEGTEASFTVTLDPAAPAALTVAVSVTESGAALSGTPLASVAFAKGATSATLSVPTAADSVVEADSTVTATVVAGTGYTVGAPGSASVTVEDDDAATFTVSADAEVVREGESATLTVAIANGVTFAEEQTISLAASGTASAADYTGVPPTLTLAPRAASATATFAAVADRDEEEAETVTVTASHGGSAIGAATVTIESVSSDATLSGLSLSGIDIGTFSGTDTAYQASVGHSVQATTVTATATHSAATVTIDPGSPVTLLEGANQVVITVTAEDGTTRKTYTVAVTRLALPTVSIVAVAERVSEGERAGFTVSRTGPATEELAVQVSSASTASAATPTLTVRLRAGQGSQTGWVTVDDNTVIEDNLRLTWTLQAGEGYTLSTEQASATVVLEENDVPEFTVSADPAEVSEGGSAAVTVAIANGVTFAEAQTISLSTSGTASAADYTGVPPTLTLAPGTATVTATLAAAADQDEEDAETVTVTAAHGGSAIGAATVTIRSVSSVSRDAALASLSLGGIDIGTFSGATTAYQASVGHGVETVTVTAAASHAGATVAIAPGAEVSLAVGTNEIRVTVTAEDGTTTKAYTVTVTRDEEAAGIPVLSIAALADRVAEGKQARFRVSRTGSTTRQLDVQVSVTTSIGSRVRTKTLRLEAGSSTSGTGYFRAQEDKVIWGEFRTTWTIQEGEGYAVSENAGSATVVVEENDVAEFALEVHPAPVAEGASTTLTLAITNGVHFAESQTIALEVTGGTASAGTDFTLSDRSLMLRGSSSEVTATLEALDDDARESDETVLLTARHGGAAIATREVTIANRDLTAELLEVPKAHDGKTAFRFELRFSKEAAVGFQMLRDEAFEVTGGSVTGARRLAGGSSLRWEITVQPDSQAAVVLTLPVPASCAAAGAICTGGGSRLAQAVTATVAGPGPEPAGFPLAPGNSRPSGIWSNGETAWVADLDDAQLYAYRRSDGEREPAKDIATEPVPMGLWSDGETIWVAGLDGGLRAHRLADGARLADRDLALEANEAPAGVWSDGETAWVSTWLGDRVHAYRLSDGERVAGRDIQLTDGNLMPVGLWSDGETLWIADWRERLYAYRLADGQRVPQRDVSASGPDTDPTGLWSGGGSLLSTSWEGREVRAYRMPATGDAPRADRPRGGHADSVPMIVDPGLRAAIREALGKGLGEAVSAGELAGLESLSARNCGVRDLAGLEAATGLKELDLGFNPLAGLWPLAALPALESLNLDGSALDLGPLAALPGLRRLSVRHNRIDDPQALAALPGLTELDVGDNRIEDLRPLAGLTRLEVLRADRNGIADLWPLAGLTELEALDLGSNRVRDLQPLAGLERLKALRLAGNGLAELHPLSGLKGLAELGLAGNAVEDLGAIAGLDGLRRLDLRGNVVGDLRPLTGLPSLVWVHVGGSRIEDLAPLDGVGGLTVAGRDDLEPPAVGDRRGDRSRHQRDPPSR